MDFIEQLVTEKIWTHTYAEAMKAGKSPIEAERLADEDILHFDISQLDIPADADVGSEWD